MHFWSQNFAPNLALIWPLLCLHIHYQVEPVLKYDQKQFLIHAFCKVCKNSSQNKKIAAAITLQILKKNTQNTFVILQ